MTEVSSSTLPQEAGGHYGTLPDANAKIDIGYGVMKESASSQGDYQAVLPPPDQDKARDRYSSAPAIQREDRGYVIMDD